MKKHNISIIIPAYNESAGISFFIQHLSKVCGPNITEVIIADGQSTDDTQQQFEWAKVQLQQSNPDFAQKIQSKQKENHYPDCEINFAA
ncbi:MAG: glycosyltransferase [Flavobacteriaceae bacterium]|nr:glycosyltransferase [Flavobacteriaceae bacterium]